MTALTSTQHVTPGAAARLERLPVSRVHYRLLVLHGFGWLFDAMDVGIITFVVVVLAKDWALSTAQVGMIGSAGLGGMFLGALLGGMAADRWGRKAVFQSTLLVFGLATLLCALAWSFESMLLFRLLVGIGLGAELPVVASLLTEFIPAQQRGRFVVLLESFWAYGWLAAAIVAFVVIPAHGWRSAFAIGAFPALYVWFLRRNLPESPRWLVAKGRFREAEEILSSLEAESERLAGGPLPVVSSEVLESTCLSDSKSESSLWSRKFRRRTLMLWVLWFGLVFGYYGIFVWLPSLLIDAGYSIVNSFLYVIIVTAAQIPGYFSAALLIERLGRRIVIVGYLVASALCAVMFGQATTTTGILVWACSMSFFNLGAWGGAYAYTPEQYPTSIRATGAGSAAACGRVGGVLAPIVVGALLPHIGREGVLIVNAGLLGLAALAVALLGTETKGSLLDDASA